MRWQYTEGKLILIIDEEKHEFALEDLEKRKDELIKLLSSDS
tara:strand:- start:3697 stop:3822 length:126 start_codon:yes stop_codon:yes gene_type:complete